MNVALVRRPRRRSCETQQIPVACRHVHATWLIALSIAGTRAMPIELQFLDWSKPALPQAARWLAERFGEATNLDLSEGVACVPGAPVRRRMVEFRDKVPAERRWLLAPAEIVTPGRFA